MIERGISEKILFIGIDYRQSKGGVPEVEQYYARIFSPMKFVATTVDGGKLCKAAVGFAGMIKFLWHMMADRKLRVVHVHACAGNSVARKGIFMRVAKMFGKIVVFHMHAGGFIGYAAAHRRQCDEVVGRADYIVALSDSWKRYFEEEFSHPAVSVIHNPVSQVMAVPHMSAHTDKITFSFLGKIVQAKGIFDLLEVIAENQNRWRGRMRLVFAGVGDTERALNYIEEAGLGDMVEFAGWVSGEKKAALLTASDVFILPSYFEGLPVCILEAMSYGLPVVATRVGGVPDVVADGETGFLIPPRESGAIAEAIDRVLANREKLPAMGAGARDVAAMFSEENVAESLREFYKSIL